MSTRLLPIIIALALAPSALAGGPTMQFGAAEDVVRTTDLPAAKAKMTLLRLAGFSSVRVTSQWQGTEDAPSEAELTVLRNVAGGGPRSRAPRRPHRAGRRPPLPLRPLPLDLPDGVARDAAHPRGPGPVRPLRDEPQA